MKHVCINIYKNFQPSGDHLLGSNALNILSALSPIIFFTSSLENSFVDLLPSDVQFVRLSPPPSPFSSSNKLFVNMFILDVSKIVVVPPSKLLPMLTWSMPTRCLTYLIAFTICCTYKSENII